MPPRNGVNIPQTKKMWIGFKKKFADKYHEPDITHNLSAVQTVYHSANSVVPTGVITCALDKMTMAAAADQSHV